MEYMSNNTGSAYICTLKCPHARLISHSHEDCPFTDKKFNSREIPKHHVDDKEEERSTPVVEREREVERLLSIYLINIWQEYMSC